MAVYLFKVERERLGGGEPQVQLLHVAAQDRLTAEQCLRDTEARDDETLTLLRELTPNEAAGLGLRDGEVRPAHD